MITRHFYKQDEVLSALVYCICMNRPREAVFWAQELIDSNLILECYTYLIIAWMKVKSIGNIAWLRSALALWESGELGEESVILLTYQLACSTERDVTPLSLLVLSLKEYKRVPDRLRKKVVGWKEVFREAVAERKLLFAWLSIRIRWMEAPEEVWDFLESLDDNVVVLRRLEKLEFLKGMEWTCRAIAVALLFPHSKSTLRTTIMPDVQKSLAEWASALGRRSRREYPIPRDCLYGCTARGLMLNTATTLHEFGDLLEQMEAGAYWSEALEGRAFVELSIDEQFEFTTNYFPDGHPMTWSTDEKAKSHGYGVLRPDEEIETRKYWSIWTRNVKSTLLWNGWYESIRMMEGKKEIFDFTQLYIEALPLWKEEMATWCFEPAKKILVIDSQA